MTRSSLLLLCLLCALPASALATVYKCVDDRGRTSYTNDRNLARGCVELNTNQPVSSVPARPATPPAASSPPANASGGQFPRVSPQDQRARDDGRRDILQTEMKNEQEQLTKARAALKEQEKLVLPEERNVGGSINGAKVQARVQPYKDQVELHERNIEALKREISRVR